MQRGIQRLENQDREEQSLVRRSLFLSPSLARTGTTQCLCQKWFRIEVIRQISETNMKSVVLDRFWGRQTRGWNQIDKTSWRKCPSWVSACLDWAAYMGLLSEFGQRTPNLLPSSYIHWEFQMAIQRIIFLFPSKKTWFLSLFFSHEEVIAKMLPIILTSPSHAIWWVEGQCCEKQQSREDANVGLIVLCLGANHFQTNKT